MISFECLSIKLTIENLNRWFIKYRIQRKIGLLLFNKKPSYEKHMIKKDQL